MKTTLTQAWEARGLSGALLRGKVRYELTRQFYKENPVKDKLSRRVGYELFAAMVFGCAAAVTLHYAVPTFKMLDLSLSLNLGFLVGLLGPAIGIFILVALFVYWSVKDALAVGSVDRYIFQHRDDGVEL